MFLSQLRPLLRMSLQRLAREGSVVRALAWPGVLSIGTLALVASIAAPGPAVPTAVSTPDHAAALERAGLPVSRDVSADTVERRWVADPPGARLVLAPQGWGRVSGRRHQDDLAVESVVRDTVQANWRLAPPPARDPSQHRAQARAQAALLARLVAMVCALYAVVLTVAAAVRDRENGVLEALHSSPIHPSLPAASRALAISLGCGVSLTITTAALGGLLPLSDLGGKLPGLVAAVVGGAAVGTGALGGLTRRASGPWSGAPAGMSQPLRAALVAASGLGALGTVSSHAAALPLATLGATATTPLQGWVALMLACAALAWACARVGRVGW